MPKEIDERVFGKEMAVLYKLKLETLQKSIDDGTFDPEVAQQ